MADDLNLNFCGFVQNASQEPTQVKASAKSAARDVWTTTVTQPTVTATAHLAGLE